MTLGFVEPHLRFYTQTAADFYRFGLIEGAPLPQYATSDYRMTAFQSLTLGATIGFAPGGRRAPASGRSAPSTSGSSATARPRARWGCRPRFDLFPTVNVFSLVVNYRFNR